MGIHGVNRVSGTRYLPLKECKEKGREGNNKKTATKIAPLATSGLAPHEPCKAIMKYSLFTKSRVVKFLCNYREDLGNNVETKRTCTRGRWQEN